MVYNALDCAEDDYYALFVLCLLYAMSHNKGKQFLLFPEEIETRVFRQAWSVCNLFMYALNGEKFFTGGGRNKYAVSENSC